MALHVKSHVPWAVHVSVELTGGAAQGAQDTEPKHPVCGVFWAQMPAQRCCAAPQSGPPPAPVLLLVVAGDVVEVDVLVPVVVDVVLVDVVLLLDVSPPAPPMPEPAPPVPSKKLSVPVAQPSQNTATPTAAHKPKR